MGVTYDENSLLFDPWTRSIANLPHSAYYDWMHCLVASGGVAQYELNEIVKVFRTHGVSLEDIDEFVETLHWPRSQSKLRRGFFQSCFVSSENGHSRAFAAETLSAITALGKFADAVVKPLGVASDHVACFDSLRLIADLLSSGDCALQHVDLLKRTLATHHERFVALYPGCAKPKLHFLRHVPELMQRHGSKQSKTARPLYVCFRIGWSGFFGQHTAVGS